MDKNEVEQKIQTAMNKLFDNEHDLLENKGNERTISGHLFRYLSEEFEDYNVDPEYNRNLSGVKALKMFEEKARELGYEAKGKFVYPDIIVHIRGTHERNLLVIEIKTTADRDPNALRERDRMDLLKLQAFKHGPYSYQHAYFLKIGTGPNVGFFHLEPAPFDE